MTTEERKCANCRRPRAAASRRSLLLRTPTSLVIPNEVRNRRHPGRGPSLSFGTIAIPRLSARNDSVRSGSRYCGVGPRHAELMAHQVHDFTTPTMSLLSVLAFAALQVPARQQPAPQLPASPIAKLVVTPAKPTMIARDTLRLSAQALDASGRPVDNVRYPVHRIERRTVRGAESTRPASFDPARPAPSRSPWSRSFPARDR